MTGAALRRDGSYLRCKVCSAVPRRGKLRGYLSSANIFRRGDVWGWGETTGEVEEAQSILFSAFVCIGSLLGVWWICSHHALSVLLLVGGFMHEALKVWISRLLEKSYKDRQGHKVKEKAVNIFLFCVVRTVELGHVLHLLLCLWAPPPSKVLIASLGFIVRAVMELISKKLAQHGNADFQQRIRPPVML